MRKQPFGSLRVSRICLITALAILYLKPLLLGQAVYPDIPVVRTGDPEPTALTIHYHERPPYYVTGALGIYGLCCDPVRRACREAGIPIRWQKTPAVRQLDLLRFNTADEAAVGWFKNPQRERFAVYSHPIYRDRPFIALKRRDNTRIPSACRLAELLKNKDAVLLRKKGYSYGRYIDNAVNQLRPAIQDTTAGNIGMLKQLYDRHADYFFLSEEEALELVRTSGLPSEDFAVIRFSDVPEGSLRYLLFGRGVDKTIIERFNAAVAGLEIHKADSGADRTGG